MRELEIIVELQDGVTEVGVFNLAKHLAFTEYLKNNHPSVYDVLQGEYNFDIQVYKLEERSQ